MTEPGGGGDSGGDADPGAGTDAESTDRGAHSGLLSARHERAWRLLHEQIERAGGFWLGFLVTSDAAAAAALRERSQRCRQSTDEPFGWLDAPSAQRLAGLGAELRRRGVPPTGCNWVSAGLDVGPTWLAGWQALLESLAADLGTLRTQLGGVLLVGPPELLRAAAGVTPELWEARDLVVELPAEPASPPVPADAVQAETVALAAAGTDELLGRARDRAANLSVQAVRAGVPAAGDLLHARATAEAEAGEADTGYDLVRCALALDGVDETRRIELLALGTALAAQLADQRQAAEWATQWIELAEQRTVPSGTTEDWQSLADALGQLGRAEAAAGRHDAARQPLARAVEIDERLTGDEATADARRRWSIGLVDLGDVDLALGEPWSAGLHLAKALEINEGLLTEADSSAARADLVHVLRALAEANNAVGQQATARDQLLRCIELAEQLVDEGGGWPARQKLSVVLFELASVEQELGDVRAAREHVGRSVAIDEALAVELGSWQARVELASSLARLADLEFGVGEIGLARSRYARCVELDDAMVGRRETPDALRKLAFDLERLADAEHALGELDAARAHYQRSSELLERLPDAGQPDQLRLLARVLRNLADLSEGEQADRIWARVLDLDAELRGLEE